MRGFTAVSPRARGLDPDPRETAPARGGVHALVQEHVAHMFDVMIEGDARPRSLRSSSLPYCPVLDVVVPRESEVMDLKGILFTTMGTVAHTGLQAFATLGAPGANVWGNWKCPRCGHQWLRPCFRPDACPARCNEAPVYVELTFRYGIMSGHCDLVVRFSGDRWVVYEFKTIGRKPLRPKRQHLLQARTYCAMLKRQHGITAGYVIVYVQRENLAVHTFGPYDYRSSAQQTNDWITRAIAGFRAASAVHRNASAANLVEVARCRPCIDRATHDEYMARRYEFSVKPCEMLGNCSRSDVHVARMMRGLLEE